MSVFPTTTSNSAHEPTTEFESSPSKRPRVSYGVGTDKENNFAAGAASTSSPQAMDIEMSDGQNGVANGDAGDGPHYDQQLYSRQIYALGEQAMQRLRIAKVLVSGIGGVGVEIAKNLILGGVRHVTLHDTQPTSWLDLAAQYYLNESDVGKNRAAASLEKLSELNDSVSVSCLTESLTEAIVQRYDLVILTDTSFSEQLHVNEWTRKHGKKFLIASAVGLFGQVFCDFGAEFQVDDVNGEQSEEVLIEHIDRHTGDVTTQEDARHNLEDGDYVAFSEVKGMTELNGAEPRRVRVISPSKFNIGDLAKLSDYKEGGLAKHVKMPKILKFKSLKQSLTEPEFLISDFAKMERPSQLHLGWQALHKFIQMQQRLPLPRNEDDAHQVLQFAREINAAWPTPLETIDDKLIKELSFQACGRLCPVMGFIGGVAAQEAMKAVSGIFHPIYQWLYFDALECLPDADTSQFKLSADLCKIQNCRYDGQIAVFGSEIQHALGDQRWFIVGAGAIGCELLKYFAMMGLGCGAKGLIRVTDMDQIEMSNLNRQFLFRRGDIGSKKSEVAARAVQTFNPKVHVKALAERVGGDTENIFNDAFFDDLHGVANALDNVDARAYMDRRCVYYRLPLLESGTLGPKANTQVVYPHLTESYSSSHDPPEKSIPICTLKNFPYRIEHTIQWARDLFEGLFSNPAELANQFIEDPRGFHSRLEKLHTGQKLEMLEGVKKVLIDDKPKNAEDCIRWARTFFEDNFNNQILQLLFNFPADQVTSQGAKFWSGTKRCPHAVAFDPHNKEHVDFVWAASCLRAEMYGLQPLDDKVQVAQIAAQIKVPTFTPKAGVRIAVSDQEAQQLSQDTGDGDEEHVQKLQIALAKLGTNMVKMKQIDFEKDDDTNKHMDFIVNASNLRAENYAIEKADKLKTKQIAGRIIPAIATATAAVAGLVCLELYKIVIGNCKLEHFKNGFLNLALPFYGFSEPIKAPVKKYYENEWTLWDRIDVTGEMTLQAYIDYMAREHKLEMTMLSQGVSMLYSFFMAKDKKEQRLKMTIGELVTNITQRPIPEYVRALVLEMMCNTEDGEDAEVPYVRYLLPGRN